MRYVLGLDGGGTKCDAVLMDEEGKVVGWGRGGSTHGLYVGEEAAYRSVHDAVLGAVADFRPQIDRVAGAARWAAMEEWLDQPVPREHYVPVSEVTMGFAMALATHGVLVLSGTGSFVNARSADGRSVHEGGQGPIIADEGSAHHIGILGIRAAFRSHWSEARHTSLAEAIPRAYGVEKLRDVFNLLYVDRIGRSQIAAAARTVDEAAMKGDRVAIRVLEQAADDLGELLVEVIRGIGFEDTDEYMVATGSVAQGSSIFWNRLCRIAHEVAPRLRPVQPKIKPVMGACLLALRDLGVEWTPELLARIEQTQTGVPCHRSQDSGG